MTVERVREGRALRNAAAELSPELVLIDLQIGSMGGFAAAIDLRLEEGAARLEPQRIILMLDRAADEFMARRSDVGAWLIKPFDALALRLCAEGVIAAAPWVPVADPSADPLLAER